MEFVVIWPIFVMIIVIVAMRRRHERKLLELKMRYASEVRAPAAAGLVNEERRELQDLRERIKVLERIATDGNSLDARETRRIAQEIEALRDRQDG